MGLTADQLAAVRTDFQNLTRKFLVLAANAAGIDALDTATIDDLVSRGLLTTEAVEALKRGDHPDLIGDAMLTGLLLHRIAEAGEDAANWDRRQWVDEIKRRKFALSATEKRAVEIASDARTRVGIYCQGLANKVADQAMGVVVEALNEDRSAAVVGDDERRNKTMGSIAQAVAEGVEGRKDPRWIASRMLELTNDGARDLLRIASTEAQRVHEQAKAEDIETRYDGGETRVFKRLSPNACKHCRAAYLDSDGKPRLFTMRELRANGNNFGRKAADWKPTLDPMHPYCGCELTVLPPGYTFDDKGMVIRDKSQPVTNLQLTE